MPATIVAAAEGAAAGSRNPDRQVPERVAHGLRGPDEASADLPAQRWRRTGHRAGRPDLPPAEVEA